MTELEQVTDQLVEHLRANEPMFAVARKEIRGVELNVFANAPATMRDLFAFGATHGDLDFLVYNDERYSFNQVLQLAANFSHVLTETCKVEKGERVAIAMRNYPEWIISFMAILSVGAVAVPMNGWWTAEEFAYGLEDSGARVVIADKERIERIRPAQDKLGLSLIAVRCSEAKSDKIAIYEELMAATPDQPPCDRPIDPDDDATILYTSGSTGHPKGAVSTHRAIISTLFSWTLIVTARKLADEKINGTPEESEYQPATLMTIPLFHVTGCHSIYLMSVLGGRKIVLTYKWDPEEALQLIEKERITSFTGVPTMSFEILNSPNVDKYDLSSLRDFGAGGAARPAKHVALLKEKFPDKDPGSGYGLTETNALGAINFGDSYVSRPGSTGKPTPPVLECKLVDEDGQEVKQGERGEILLRGPQNVRGYWNKPEATAAAFTSEGWFHTGDIAYQDEDGYLYIVDRAKDIVIRGGENISCNEVESALFHHPDVLEASVFGVPDERLGEALGAVVAAKPGKNPSPEELKSFLAQHIAKFKVPSYLWVQQEQLPRIATGKIAKKDLKAWAIEELNLTA